MAAPSVADEQRRLGSEPDSQKVSSARVSNSLLLTVLSLGASALGMVSQIVQAHRFGASAEIGAYFAAFSVTGMIVGMAPAIFSSVVVPQLVALENDPKQQRRVASALLAMVAVAAVLTTASGIALEPVILRILMPNVSPALAALATRASTILWLTVGLSLLVSFLCAVCQAKSRFWRVGIAPLLPPLAVAGSVLAFGQSMSVISIPIGLLAAAALQLALLLWGASPYLGRPIFAAAVMLRFWKSTPPIILSLLPFTAAPFIAIFWAERVDPRAVPFLGYCQSVATILSVAVSYGLATTSFPDLARQAACGDYKEFFAVSRSHLQSLLVLSGIAATLLGVCRVPILKILLSHGAFDVRAVAGTAQLLPWYLIGAVCVACLNFLRNVFYAKGDHWTVALLGIAAPLVFFVCGGWAGRHWGVAGIAFSYSLGFATYSVLAVAVLRVPGLTLWSAALGWVALRVAVVCVAAAELAEEVGPVLPHTPTWMEGLILAAMGAGTLTVMALFALSAQEKSSFLNSALARRIGFAGRSDCSKTF